MLTFLVITAVGHVAIAVLLSHFDPSANYLALGDGSVIDCEQLSSFQKMIYSDVSILQHITDNNYDYGLGLSISVWSAKRDKFLKEDLQWTFESKNITGNIFQIKNVSNNTYMWQDSVISFNVSSKVSVNKLQAYLIRGDDNKAQFFHDTELTYLTERSQNLLRNGGVYWRVRHSGYYYVAVLVEPLDTVDSETDFFANVYFSTNVVNTKKGKSSNTLDKLDSPVEVKIDFYDNHRILCKINPIKHTKKINQIHLKLTYTVRKYVYAVPVVIALIFTILFFHTLGYGYSLWSIGKKTVRRRQVVHRRGYTSIQ